MRATDLSPELWQGIQKRIEQSIPRNEIVMSTVTRRDKDNMLIWVEDFGELSIPLVGLVTGFEYFDLSDLGDTLRFDATYRATKTYSLGIFKDNPELPKLGDRVILLVPFGVERFPMCLGVIQSKNYWREDM